MKTPKAKALHTAAEWLDCYDGDNEGGDNEAECKQVAKWLREQAAQIELRAVAKELGIPVRKVRERFNTLLSNQRK